MPYIKITDKDGAQASMNNGLTVVTLEHGQVYEVTDFVANALINAKRAKRASKADIAKLVAAAEAPEDEPEAEQAAEAPEDEKTAKED